MIAVIADDHPLVRDALGRIVCQLEGGAQVESTSPPVRSAIRVILLLSPMVSI